MCVSVICILIDVCCLATNRNWSAGAFKTELWLQMQLQSAVGLLKRVAAKCVSDEGENKLL